MLRKAKKLVRAHGERVVALALLPVLLLGAAPHLICICADGQRQAACPSLKRQAARCASHVADGKSCCRHDVQPGAHQCCLAHKSPAEPSAPADGIAPDVCCRPVIEAAAPALAQKRATDSASPSVLAASMPLLRLIATVDLWPALVPAAQATPPPVDKVIFFSRLTI